MKLKKCEKWLNSKIKHMVWLDISMVKLAVFAFTLLLVKYFPVLTALEWYWYAAVFLLAMIKPLITVFK